MKEMKIIKRSGQEVEFDKEKIAAAIRKANKEVGERHRISDAALLATNLEENCIPNDVDTMDVSSYDEFLFKRRKMMAALIKKYYRGL